MVAVLTGSKSNVISTKDGAVTLDLSGVANESSASSVARHRHLRLGESPTRALHDRDLPVGCDHPRATRLQVFNTSAIVLPFLTILLFIGGILLFPNRRRGALWAAVALSLGMAVLLLALAIGRPSISVPFPRRSCPRTRHRRSSTRSYGSCANAARLAPDHRRLACIFLGPGSGATRFRAWVAPARRRGRQASDRGVDSVRWAVGRQQPPALRIGIAVLAAILLIAWDQPTAIVVFVVALIAC
jgi:hypothetical protein